MIPRRTSRSKSAFTFLFQWWGTGMGVGMYAGNTPSSLNLISIAAPDNPCSGWWVQVLKALELNIDKKYCSNFARFSLVAGKGSLSGISGVDVRSVQGTPSSSQETAALVGWPSPGSFSSAGAACDLDIPGNPSGRRPKSDKAFSDKCKPLKALTICSKWRRTA